MTTSTPAGIRSSMTLSRWAIWAAAWTGGAVLAVANGALRELVITPRLGDLAGRQVSTLTLLILLAIYVNWLCRHWPLPTYADALRVGALWVLLTVTFEFGLGHFVEGKSWVALLADYDVSAGRIWLLVPLWTLVAPAVMTCLQRSNWRQRSNRGRDARP